MKNNTEMKLNLKLLMLLENASNTNFLQLIHYSMMFMINYLHIYYNKKHNSKNILENMVININS
jgi:hypothetical protein